MTYVLACPQYTCHTHTHTQPAINSLRGDIDFDCPNGGYISGFVSEYTGSNNDRVWSPYCCNRNFSTLINCQRPTSSWENVLRDNLNYSAPSGYVIAGVQSFYFNRYIYRVRLCVFTKSVGDATCTHIKWVKMYTLCFSQHTFAYIL